MAHRTAHPNDALEGSRAAPNSVAVSGWKLPPARRPADHGITGRDNRAIEESLAIRIAEKRRLEDAVNLLDQGVTGQRESFPEEHVHPSDLHGQRPRLPPWPACLVGDAGSLSPPFTGSGVFKAISNAVALADALNTETTIDQAVEAWNGGQLQHAATIGHAAELFERPLIFDMPDLAAMSDDDFTSWNRGVWAEAAAPIMPKAPPQPPSR